jgi:hypothetical protein
MHCIIACIVCQSTQLHWEHCCMQDVLHHCLYCTSVNTTSLGALLHVRCTASYMQQCSWAKLCWLTYNTSDDAVYRTCSIAPSEVVLTDIQYKRWCSTSYMQQCSQWSCVDWHTIQAMMQYILHATMLPVKACIVRQSTQLHWEHCCM